MPSSPRKLSSYIPTLDGWRAISIALVILRHSRVPAFLPVLGPILQVLSVEGDLGVELFFAISGLLICTRLLDEESRTGRIHLRNFYLRRSFRILPAAVLYLSVIALLAACHLIPLLPADWFGALFFFRNYTMLSAYLHNSPRELHWYTGHFWSLSMEEHFYLLLPGLLVIFKRARLRILGGAAIAVALWRAILHYGLHQDYQFTFRTDTQLDALLIPAMIALVLFPVLRNDAARRFIPAWSFLVFLLIEVATLTIRIPLVSTVRAVVLPLLVLSTVLHPKAIAGRFLEWLPLRWIGGISYSLYLWQQLFLGANMVSSPPHIAVLRQAPACYVALFGCAVLSYYVVEKPCIRLGHRWIQAMQRRGRRDVGHWGVAVQSKHFAALPPKSRMNTAS